MRNKKIIYNAIGIGIFFLLFLMSSYLLLKTPVGTAAVLSCARYFSSTTSHDEDTIDRMTYDKVSGSILGTLFIKNLKLHLDDVDIEILALKSKTIFNPFSLSFVNQELVLDKVIVTPHFFHAKQTTNKSYFYLPITIDAKKIVITNLQINYKKNRRINFSKLASRFKFTPTSLNAAVYQIDNHNANLSFYHDKHNNVINLQFPFQKTKWKLNYAGDQEKFNLYGEIKDQHEGNIILKGIGRGNANITLNMNANNIHINDLLTDYWPGAINFNLQLAHQLKTTNVKLNNLNGIINKQPLYGAGEIKIENNTFSKLNLNVALHNSKILIVENNKIPSQIDWLIQIPKLQEFLPSIHAEILAKGIIENFSSKPIIKGEFVSNDISLKRYRLQKLAGEFQTNLNASLPSSYFQLQANNLMLHKFPVNQILLQATGCLKKHQIKIDSSAKDQKLAINIEGKYENPQWLGKVDQLSLLNNKQQWNLQKTFEFSLDKKSLSLGLISLVANQSNISLQGTYPFGHYPTGEINVRNFDLSLLNFLLPETLKLEGKINLNATAESKLADLLKINADLKPGAVYYQINHEPQKNNYNGGRFSAQMDKRDLLTLFEINLPEGKLVSKLKLPNYQFNNELKNQKLDGQINFQFNEAKILQLFIPAIKNVNGKLLGNYEITGTVLKPIFLGQLNLNQGSFQIPKLNLNVTDVNIAAKKEKNNVFYHGSLTSGSGVLTINGLTKLENKGFPIDLELHGNNILICNQPEIKILASPDMHLSLTNDALKLSGKIFLPEANIHPHDFGNSESVSDDIVFVNNKSKQPQSNLKIISSIQLSLGNKIYLNTHGIKGNVLGQIQIEDDPAKSTVAYGQLWLQDGSYNIYGKTLQIDDGKLLFSGGPISNPGLNIKASRSIQAKSNSLFAADEKIKVGVSVTGTIKEPKINLFSEPAGKSSADILSYLILGIPLNSLNDSTNKSNTQLLLQAADALNIGGNSKLFNLKNQLKKGLGLSELDIGTRSEIDPNTQETVQHTAFVLGKYLSPKFYVNYSLDLFDHTNTLKVRYLINRFWTIQSVANTNSSGVDILYTVEK